MTSSLGHNFNLVWEVCFPHTMPEAVKISGAFSHGCCIVFKDHSIRTLYAIFSILFQGPNACIFFIGR